MKVLTLVTQKGGSGKSTLVANLAVAAEEAGEKVFVLDLDRQGTLGRWIERRSVETPGFDRVSTETQLDTALATLARQDYSLVIMDTAGTDSPLVTAAIRGADLCLIPARPTPADLEATQPTLEAIQSTRRRFAFVLNQAPVRSGRLNEAAAGLKVLGILAEPPITQRNDHQDALGSGQGVTEFNTHGKAAEEIRALWRWIKNRLKG
ncbi:ParA family protein [Kaistia dalseonensis]|uniref:Chromosome partitioning protein n=1 Tax=Kaistia dalseonensis TaxID=410840 RepID=A0ABU0HG57_9HYPH|nr:ParA family protein [Kaistia dalseonensis]MCX5497872.1 ParA family protein [Kaistia dalseonensis]MDQ0440516.1 chromosome partitioning protein [Kaistia dalseonensis]